MGHLNALLNPRLQCLSIIDRLHKFPVTSSPSLRPFLHSLTYSPPGPHALPPTHLQQERVLKAALHGLKSEG